MIIVALIQGSSIKFINVGSGKLEGFCKSFIFPLFKLILYTTPGVVYKVHLNNGSIIDLQNPSSLPDPTVIKYIEEPWIKATIITPDQYLGSIIKMCQDKRGIQTNLSLSLIHISEPTRRS